MPLVTSVIDDKSPLISYDSTWIAGTALDSFATDYYRGTFTVNNVTDGLVSFSFNGTAIWIYGANRPNHGSYTVQVDSATYSNLDGAGNNLFQQSLFNISSLNQEMHTVRLTNTASGGLYVDVDMIVWQSQVGNMGDQLVSEAVQDTDSRFQYQEPAWSTASSNDINFGLFSNGTGHVTQTYDASVAFTFIGMLIVRREAISLFGTSGPSNGPYSVQLDGGQTVQYNASTIYPTNYGVMIYHADNLGPGSHQLVLTNLPATSGQSIYIDYAQLWTLVNTSAPTGTPLQNTSDVSQNKLSAGAIAGIVVAVVAAVLSAGAALLFYRRWKAAMATQQDLYRTINPQQRLLASATVAPTGFSSSLETRSNASLLRNDTSIQAFSARVQQPANYDAAQYDAIVPAYPGVASGSRDSRSIVDTVSSPTQSAVDEGLGRRPLPEAPGGGMSLSDEFSKLANSQRHQSIMTADHSSIAVSEVLPNYTQVIGNATTTHG
ncbi:hypothetical protein JVT61DRAFT_13726 [Boletus reticuloceps]|uniref:Transmembrane protein n=1 Tax=Boletus reticuloceps TaxID=495285 RepID=A0A8I3AAJ9_9AGAM|nr:hypothetical protein JVT61DRAFT_13726 [Boletus reticuloceps]